MVTKVNAKTIILTGLLFLLGILLNAQVRLPRLISNGMVLQRDANIKLWGWASPGEKISVYFAENLYSTTANTDGQWSVLLDPLRAGGPYSMQIKASNELLIEDIMVGDVWICSGQSNMELPMRRVSWVYPNEITGCNNKFIRQFLVPQSYDFNRKHENYSSGVWKPADSISVLDFSAVAYFFAKELYDKYKIPIGLINNALGGSPAEAWMSEEALKQFPLHYNEMQRFKDTAFVNRLIKSDNSRIRAWYDELNKKDIEGRTLKAIYSQSRLASYSWKSIKIPAYWNGTELEKINGSIWFYKSICLSGLLANKKAELILGAIVDADSVFVNGIFVGATSYKYPPRRYTIPPGVLKSGENTILVRVISSQGVGGFVPDKPYEINFGSERIDLKGQWNYRVASLMPPLESQTFVRWKPGGLYNAMLHPLMNYKIKGVIWYQGESNAGRAMEYRKLFPAMIQNWRNDWNQGNFPFLFVQLANFMDPPSQPTESNWALLRESQLNTLSVAGTAMAVSIDIGEWNDIHPLNKKDVGVRLALAAHKVAYNQSFGEYSGPKYESMKIKGNRIVLSFTHISGGLVSKNNQPLQQFAIAGNDRKFVWAQATIKKGKIVVWSKEIKHPVAVRYAWADNPHGANLYNSDGLPASPFRTDDW